MPKYIEIIKQKEFKKKRIEARLKSVNDSRLIRNYWKIVYGVEK